MKLYIDDLGKVSITTAFYDDEKDKPFSRNTIVHSLELGKSYISRRTVPVGIPLTDKRFWMPLSEVPELVMLDYATFKKEVLDKYNNIENEILNKYNDLESYYKHHVEEFKKEFESWVHTSETGIVISNRLGNSEDKTVSQATITRIINQIMNKLSDITGELPYGIKLEITPDYILSDSSSEITINASAGEGIFEQIDIYFNDEVILSKEDVKEFTEVYSIDKTTKVKVVATLLGTTYTESKTISVYYPFFIGSGVTKEDAIKTENIREYTGNIDGEYDIKIENENDKMFVVIPTSIKEQVESLTMNGFDIPFEVIADEKYVIYQSYNTYKKGVYSINIR